MAHIGMLELCIIIGLIIVLFGYKKLPHVGQNLGRGLRNFKRAMREPDEIDITPKDKDTHG